VGKSEERVGLEERNEGEGGVFVLNAGERGTCTGDVASYYSIKKKWRRGREEGRGDGGEGDKERGENRYNSLHSFFDNR
jgi:hypothetical protein